VEFVSEPIKAFATRLREKKGKHIWMMGGAGIIASFLDEGEIDEFMIHVIPKFIGEGIPLIAPGRRNVPLASPATSKKWKSLQVSNFDGSGRLCCLRVLEVDPKEDRLVTLKPGL
jgi:dihydrofolate reductase